MPRCLIIAGPNGAGKTTFAREYLPREGAVLNFVNADLLAAGLSPFDPSAVRVAAGRLFLREIDRLAASKVDFAFESTLSGTAYLTRLKRMRAAGYDVEIVYLRLADVRLSLQRIAARVRSGGHDVPAAVFREELLATSSGDFSQRIYPHVAEPAVASLRAVLKKIPEAHFARFHLCLALCALGQIEASEKELETMRAKEASYRFAPIADAYIAMSMRCRRTTPTLRWMLLKELCPRPEIWLGEWQYSHLFPATRGSIGR